MSRVRYEVRVLHIAFTWALDVFWRFLFVLNGSIGKLVVGVVSPDILPVAVADDRLK